MQIIKKYFVTVLAVATVLVMQGCQPVEVAQPLTGELAGGDESSQMAFWHTLAERPVVSNDAGMHALLLFFDGEDANEQYPERVAALIERGALPPGFDQPGEQALDYGTLAVVLTRELNIRSGIMLKAFPHSKRYASRELRYVGIYPQSTANQIISGSDFVAMIGVVEDYQRLHPDQPITSKRDTERENKMIDMDRVDPPSKTGQDAGKGSVDAADTDKTQASEAAE